MLDIIRAVIEKINVDKLEANSEKDTNNKGPKETNSGLLKSLNILPKKGYRKSFAESTKVERVQTEGKYIFRVELGKQLIFRG